MSTLRQVQNKSDLNGKEMPISALVLLSNPEESRYKEYIRDSGFPAITHNHKDAEVQEEEIRALQEKFTATDFREKLRVAEALAQASQLTSPAAKGRLRARKIEMDMANEQTKPVFLNDENEEYHPPQELLIYIMR